MHLVLPFSGDHMQEIVSLPRRYFNWAVENCRAAKGGRKTAEIPHYLMILQLLINLSCGEGEVAVLSTLLDL